MLKLFDSHCHLQFPQYAPDLPEVLSRMQEIDMGTLVVGTDLATSRAGLELAKQHKFLWAAVGLHPNDNKDEQFNAAAYEELARDPKVVAVGECGLDYFRGGGSDEERAAQIVRFEAHIGLAEQVRKTLVIHCRDPQQGISNSEGAHGDMLGLLTECKPSVPVVIHFFTGTAALAQQYLRLGCYLSFPGPVTFTDMYDEAIRVTPLDKILVETDAPFAAPVPYRGKRNEPSYVVEVARKLSILKGVSLEEMAAMTTKNAQKVFGVA